MSKMSYSEAGKLGAKKSRILQQEKKREADLTYLQNPKLCPVCSSIIPRYKRKNKYCSHSCAAKVTNLGQIRTKDPLHNCRFCGKLIQQRRTYCNRLCNLSYRKQLADTKITNGVAIRPEAVKRFLVEQFGHKCSICHTEQWLGQLIGLILDHIDGNSANNDLSNLRLVCSNCDYQLPTYKSRNKGNGRHNRRQRYLEGNSY